MRTNEKNQGLQLPKGTLPEMRARLALLNAAISALQRYQEDMPDNVSDAPPMEGVRPRPFLVARRDDARAEKAS